MKSATVCAAHLVNKTLTLLKQLIKTGATTGIQMCIYRITQYWQFINYISFRVAKVFNSVMGDM
jgi:hypothetical protein